MGLQKNAETTARILIVDDDIIQGAIISNIAAQNGYSTTCVSTLDAAAKSIALQAFDCITIDLVLGDRDGIELLRLVSELAKGPRVIVISGCDERILAGSIRMAHALGVSDATWLSKPLDLGALGNALASNPELRPAAPVRRQNLIKPDATHIELGLQRHEFYPLFQPKIQISSGRVIGCEALARWISPDCGSVTPDVFIPAAERANCIKSLTMVLLEDSILAAKRFIRRDPAFVLAVNLSASLLSDILLPEEIGKLLLEHEFPAASLMLEVTESVAMADVQLAMDVLLRLRIRGIGISMDDFGTGYSSLAVLARMPFTEIKIDRSFVGNCLHDENLWKIVRGAVALGHEFKLKVVAEGVEDLPTWRALNTIGCDIGQGYYFSAALSEPGFTAWHDGWDRRPRFEAAA